MRLVVSLSGADRQIFIIVSVLLVIGIAVILFVIMSGSYFINSIVIPVKEIGVTARKIALGDFNARLEKKYNDEIGDPVRHHQLYGRRAGHHRKNEKRFHFLRFS